MIRENGPLTLTATLAAFFAAHPGEWIDGRRLATIAGAYAWRTRLSQCRRAPWHMTIENRIRRIHLYWDPEWNGRRIQVSEYRYLPADAVDSGSAAARNSASVGATK